MNGVWFAAVMAALMVAGVAAQLGWQLPQMAEVKRVLRLDRQASDQEPARAPTPAVAAEPR